jgi:hypothetical protein
MTDDQEKADFVALMGRVAEAFSGARSDMALQAVESIAVYLLRALPEEYRPTMFVMLMKSIGERVASDDDDDNDSFTEDALH